MFPRLRSFLATLTRREHFEDSLDEEVRFHLDAQTEDLVRTGVPPEEAARRARVRFGSIEAMKDDCRRVRGLRNIRLVHAAAALVVGVRRRDEDGPWGGPNPRQKRGGPAGHERDQGSEGPGRCFNRPLACLKRATRR